MSAQAIRAVLKPMWNALSEAAKQKWKEDAPMVKARGKRKELPPPNAETEKQYEACRARVELPSHLRRATNNPRTQVQSEVPRLEGRQGYPGVPEARPGVLLVLLHDRPTLL